jgi:hypothetical protein
MREAADHAHQRTRLREALELVDFALARGEEVAEAGLHAVISATNVPRGKKAAAIRLSP